MPSILIVDDSAVDRQLFAGILSQTDGFEVYQADSAEEALDRLDERDIDVVVTDLQMPGMDGLQLVQEIRRRFPDIPTILATGFGSEEIAAKALRVGAAGYVPKSNMAQQLVPTIHEVDHLLHSECSYERLLDRASITHFEFVLENDLSLVPPVLDLSERMLAGLSTLDRVDRLRIGVAIEQALHNALFHGNLEMGESFVIPFGDEPMQDEVRAEVESRIQDEKYRDRKVRVAIDITPSEFLCKIRDDGAGFEVDPDTGLANSSGRGLILMDAFMDDVIFSPRGNEVTLKRRWAEASEAVEAPIAAELVVSGQESTAEASKDEVVDSLIAPPPQAEEEDVPMLGEVLGTLVASDSDKEFILRAGKQLVGRRNTCHVVLPYHDVSAHHCQLILVDGWWFVRDLNSSNGIKINNRTVQKGRLMPGDRLSVADHDFEIQYSPEELGAIGVTPPVLE